ncbi:MAG: UDP-3-O-(3-hydroxymyristoyl)glucosamine N-acyltransferase [Byssovorax sp.]
MIGPAPSPLTFRAPIALGRLAEHYGGEVDPAARDLLVSALGPIETAGEGELAPFVGRRYLRAARASKAVILTELALAQHLPAGRRWIHPYALYTLARMLHDLGPPPPPDERHLAFIEAGAAVDETASIGVGAVIRAGVTIGPGARVEPQAVLYAGTRVGARVKIGAGAVVGRPGFGWTKSPDGALFAIPQLGGVVIEDDAEIGPLCTIDAGTLRPTVIGRGAKLDAHVHVGHNGRIGAGTLVAAQSGFAGSVEVGAGVRLGGQAGVADHVKIGDGANVAAKSGVIGDVDPGATVAGYPALDRVRWLKVTARALRDLDERPKKRG